MERRDCKNGYIAVSFQFSRFTRDRVGVSTFES